MIYNQYIGDNEDVSKCVPFEFYLFKVDEFFNRIVEVKYIDDKNYYDLLFKDILQPKTVVRKIAGVFLDEQYVVISIDDVVSLCQRAEKVIIKSSTGSCGGHGVSFWNSKQNQELLIEKLSSAKNLIVQECVTQHPSMAALNETSLNTIRLQTLFFNQQVHVITQFVRFGSPNMEVDNVSSGGMYCGIKDDGSLESVGYNHKGVPMYLHPSGMAFNSFSVPNFPKCIDLVKIMAPRMANNACLISWDLAINSHGDPVLIEPNMGYPNILVNQIACGPLFGTIQEQVIAAVMGDKE